MMYVVADGRIHTFPDSKRAEVYPDGFLQVFGPDGVIGQFPSARVEYWGEGLSEEWKIKVTDVDGVSIRWTSSLAIRDESKPDLKVGPCHSCGEKPEDQQWGVNPSTCPDCEDLKAKGLLLYCSDCGASSQSVTVWPIDDESQLCLDCTQKRGPDHRLKCGVCETLTLVADLWRGSTGLQRCPKCKKEYEDTEEKQRQREIVECFVCHKKVEERTTAFYPGKGKACQSCHEKRQPARKGGADKGYYSVSKEVRNKAAESTPIRRKRPAVWTEEEIQATLDMLPETVGCSDCNELVQKKVTVLYRGSSTNWIVCLCCHEKRRKGQSKPERMEACGVCGAMFKRIGLYVQEIGEHSILGAIFRCPACKEVEA